MSESDIRSYMGKVVYTMLMDLQIKSGVLTDCVEGGYYGIATNGSDEDTFTFRQPKDIYATEIEVRAEKFIYRYQTKKKLQQVLPMHAWEDIDKEAVEYAIEHFPEKLI